MRQIYKGYRTKKFCNNRFFWENLRIVNALQQKHNNNTYIILIVRRLYIILTTNAQLQSRRQHFFVSLASVSPPTTILLCPAKWSIIYPIHSEAVQAKTLIISCSRWWLDCCMVKLEHRPEKNKPCCNNLQAPFDIQLPWLDSCLGCQLPRSWLFCQHWQYLSCGFFGCRAQCPTKTE